MKGQTVKYFGYGANASKKMMGAIIGREPNGLIAQVENYELWIQSWREIPPEVRKILRIYWHPDFKTYCIRPYRGEVVNGYVWFITPRERQLVSQWEFWYQPIRITVRAHSGKLMTAETEIIDSPAGRKTRSNGRRYKLFLNKKKQMLEVAKKTRGLSLPTES